MFTIVTVAISCPAGILIREQQFHAVIPAIYTAAN